MIEVPFGDWTAKADVWNIVAAKKTVKSMAFRRR
jgi:hypothetical protein